MLIAYDDFSVVVSLGVVFVVTKCYTIRLADEIAAPYVELAQLMGVPVSLAFREALAEAAPHLADRVELVRASRSGDERGVLAAVRALAEGYESRARRVVEEVDEVQEARQGIAYRMD